MKRISIKVTLEKEIIMTEEVWESLDRRLPCDFDDLEVLEDVMIMSNLEFKDAKFHEEWEHQKQNSISLPNKK